MKNKKGFTLTELIAIVVILAIVALIAVPIIIDIINKANKSAFKNTAYGILKAGELYYAQQKLNSNKLTEDKEFIFPNDISGLEIKGKLPEQGIVKITEEGNMALAISNGRYCVIKEFDETDITIYESDEPCSLSGTRFVKGESELILSYGNGKNITNYKIFGNTVQNGTPTPETPVEVESVGDKTKNLSNIETLTFQQYREITLNESIPAGTYTFSSIITSTDTDNSTCAVTFIGTNDQEETIFLPRSVDGERVSKTFTIDYPIYDIRFYASYNYQNATEDTASFADIQIEEGPTATDYEPYGYKIPIKVSNDTEEIITNIYLDEPLRSLDAHPDMPDTSDYIDFENRKLVRKIKKVDINEFTWKRRTDSYTYIFETIDNSIKTGRNPFCNMLDNTGVPTINGIISMKGNYLIKGSESLHKIYVSDYIHTTVEEFLAPLKGAYIIYPLETPIEETIELPNIPTLKGETILKVDTKIHPLLTQVTY